MRQAVVLGFKDCNSNETGNSIFRLRYECNVTARQNHLLSNDTISVF